MASKSKVKQVGSQASGKRSASKAASPPSGGAGSGVAKRVKAKTRTVVVAQKAQSASKPARGTAVVSKRTKAQARVVVAPKKSKVAVSAKVPAGKKVAVRGAVRKGSAVKAVAVGKRASGKVAAVKSGSAVKAAVVKPKVPRAAAKPSRAKVVTKRAPAAAKPSRAKVVSKRAPAAAKPSRAKVVSKRAPAAAKVLVSKSVKAVRPSSKKKLVSAGVPQGTPVAEGVVREAVRPSPSSVRRAKEKEKGSSKSPFSHTDHASIFKAVEARKAAARAKQARQSGVQTKVKKTAARRLTDKQLAEFEQMLLRIRAELLRQIAYLRGVSLTRSDEVNPEEDGTDAFERQLALKLAAGEGDSIFEIDEALERIRQSTYSVCEECSCIIPIQRLKALPFARRCVECQSRIEQNPNVSEHRYF